MSEEKIKADVGVGLDPGYHRTKVAFVTGQFSLPSQAGVTPVDYGRADVGLGALPFQMLEPYNLLIGEAAQMQGIGTPDLSPKWFKSPRYFGLVAAALIGSSNLMQERYRVVMGLPVSYMALKAELEETLNGMHVVRFAHQDGRQSVHLNVTVVAQGVGALACGLIERDGTITAENAPKISNPLEQPLTGCADLGAGTSCFVLARGLKSVSDGTKSVDIGAWEIERLARALIIDAYGADLVRKMTPHVLLRHLREGSLKDMGQPVPTKNIWDQAREQVAGRIIDQMRAAWPVREVEHITITGGCGMLLEPWLTREFPQASLVEGIDPVFANAEGYLRIARMLVARGG